MGGTATLTDPGSQQQTAQPPAPAAPHPLDDLGFKPTQPAAAAHPLADLGFKPTAAPAPAPPTPAPAGATAPLYTFGQAQGLRSPGNIDVNNRPVVPNPQTGDSSTVWSMSFGNDKGEVLIPRITDGEDGKPSHILSDKRGPKGQPSEAEEYYTKYGRHLGVFDSPANATAYAQKLHEQQANLANQNGRTAVPVAGAGAHGLPQPAAHPAANLQPSMLGEVVGAAKEAATHPIETLTGADLPSQTAEKQAMLEKSAAGGDKLAKSALDVQKTEQAPLVHWTDTKTFQKIADPKSKNVFSRVVTGGSKALEALSAPDNVMLLGTLPFAPEDATRLLSGVFGAQMAQGAGEKGYDAIRAAHRGDYGQAAEDGATALINAAMAAASAKHATVEHGAAPVEEKPVLHDSNNVEELRASAERQSDKIGDAAATAAEGVPGAKLEAVRDSKDTDRIEDKAARQGVQPNQIADIAAAKITVPDQAAADKVLEKLHEQMPVESVNGTLEEPGKNGVRQVQAVVNTGEPKVPEGMTRLYHGGDAGRYDGPAWFSTDRNYAEGYANKNGRTGAEVQYVDYPTSKINELADPDGNGQTPDKGFHHTLELDSSETGPRKPLNEPVKRAEVLIQTPEMHEATARTHDDYRKSQELRAAGNIEEANALEEKITAEHEAAAKLSESTQGERGKVVSSGETSEQAASTTEPKYEFGSTQTNIPLEGKGEAKDLFGNAVETPKEKEEPVQRMPVGEMKLDPQRFQYKLNTDSTGVTNLLKGRKWNENLAGLISAWRDPADGKVYVVNGHHRFQLARENGVSHVSVRLIDVPTAQEARAVGALQNIAEGRGTPLDAAKFFRDSGYTPERLDDLGVSMGEATAANGVALARLDPSLFDQVVSGKLRQGRAIAIGKASADAADQEALMKLIQRAENKGRKVTDDVVDELARMVKGAGQHTETQNSLFGAQEMTKNLAIEKAEISNAIRERIGQERRTFQGVADAGKAATLGQVKGQTIKAAENADIAKKAAQSQELYDKLSTRGGTIDDILNQAAKELAAGGNANAIKQRAYNDARADLSKTLAGATGADDQRVQEAPQTQERPAGSAPKPLASRAESGASAGGGSTGPARTAELKAPKPPANEAFKPGRQNTPVQVRDADGNWKNATLDYRSPPPFEPVRSRVTLENGTKLKKVADGDLKPADYVPPSGRKAEMRAVTDDPREAAVIARTRENLPEYTKDYLKKNSKDGVVTVATDAAKELYPEFKEDPTRNERLVHVSASAIADAALNTELAKPIKDGKDVVDIVTASPGSGKTFTQTGDADDRVGLRQEIIFTKDGEAHELMKKIMDTGRTPVIQWIYVDDPAKTVERMAYRAAGHGGKPGILRTVPVEFMAEAYTKVPKVLLSLMDDFGDKVKIRATDNSGGPGEAKAIADPRQTLEKMAKLDQKQVLAEMRTRLEALKDQGVFKGEKGQAIYETANSTSEKAGFAQDLSGVDGSGGRPNPEEVDRAHAQDGQGSEVSGAVLDRAKSDSGISPEPPKLGVGEISARTAEAGTEPAPAGDVGREVLAKTSGNAERPHTDETVRRESEENATRATQRKEQLDAAAKRSQRENAANHKSEVVEAAGQKALVLDPDGEGVWHRLFRKVKDQDGKNPLGAGESWRGVSLTKTQVNTAIAYLHGAMGDLDVMGVPDSGAREGYQRLAKMLKDARNEQGGATILRGDYRADTAREEATHQWQRQHGLDRSDAMMDVADRPEFEATVDKLRDNGYDNASPREVATEIMAKAMAGDPDLDLTDEEREGLVRSFLTAAVEEKGPAILKTLPETDPRLKDVISEVRKGYDDGEQHDQRDERGGGQTPRGGDGQTGREAGKADGAGEGAGRRESGSEGVQPGEAERAPAKGELKAPRPPERKKESTTGSEEPVFQRAKAPKPPPSMALPGMESADVERAEVSAEEEGKQLSEKLLEPLKDISKNAGKMERESPLFFGKGDQPLLFQRDVEENPVAKSVSDLVDDLKKLPKAEKGTALDRVAGWTKDAVEDSLNRSGKALGGVPSGFEKAFAWAKATTAALVHDYTHPLEQTDWKTQAGQMQLANTETALKLQDLAKELKAQAPKELDRIAMTHWMEAAGNEAKLKEWRAGAKARAMQGIGSDRARYLRDVQGHYEQALKLTPEQKKLALRLRQHFDDTLDIAKKNGLIEFGYRNYVMHLYEKAEAANILHLIDTSELNPDPSFIKRRFHDTFYSAEGAGLTPKTKDIGYLLTAYDKSMNEAIASRNFMRNLLDAKAPDGRPIAAIKTRGGWVIAKDSEAPEVLQQRERPKTLEGYRDFDRPQLRNFLFKPTTADLEGFDPKLFEDDPENLAFRGDLIIHPKYASRVEDMLTPSWFERGEGGAQKLGSAIVKGSALAKELMTAVAPFHMVQEGVHGMEHKVNPFKLPKIDISNKTQRLLASHGLTLTNYEAEGLFGTKALKGLGEFVPGVNKAMDAMQSFSRWQFEDYIPRLKMQMATEAFERNVKRYPKLSEEQVAELTAKQSNAAFGNLNTTFDSIPRTKTFKTLLRLATFAPDFLESRIRFVGQAFTKYGGEQRAALIRGALAMYTVARVSNALLNDGDAKWDAEHAFAIVRNGKSYSLRTVQGDILHAVTDPRGFIYNRLNPLTTRPIVEFLSGRDQMGRQKTALSQVKDVAKSALPFGIQKIIQTPDEDWLNSILTSTGLESRNYRTPTEEAVHKLYIAGIPDSKEDEAKQAETRKLRGYEDKVRSGHMTPAQVWEKVERKEITPQEAGRTIQRSQRSRLQIEFSHLRLNDAIDVYAKATPLEQAELKPEFARKQAAIADLPESQREKTAEKMQELLAENQQK